MRFEQIEGKVFRGADGVEFGVIRALSAAAPSDLPAQAIPFAEDSCGNFFVHCGQMVGFWDHETGQIRSLADSEEQFLTCLVEPSTVTLRPNQVRSVWVDPTFAKKGRES